LRLEVDTATFGVEMGRSKVAGLGVAFIGGAGVLWLLSGCAEPIRAVAQRPVTNVLATTRLQGTYSLDLSDVPEDEYCAYTAGLADFCISKFRGAYKFGLDEILRAFVARGPGKTLTAKFKLVDFSHSPAGVVGAGPYGGSAVGAVYVDMRWQFTLTDESGNALVAIASSTRGPKAVANTDDVGAVVRALIESTLEEIARTMNAKLKAPPVPPTAPG
jgi:hypothetical protein